MMYYRNDEMGYGTAVQPSGDKPTGSSGSGAPQGASTEQAILNFFTPAWGLVETIFTGERAPGDVTNVYNETAADSGGQQTNELISGVPNWAVGLGVVAAGVGLFFALR
jgi:hypothetical protein